MKHEQGPTSSYTPEKNASFPPGCYQLPIAPRLGTGALDPLACPYWNFGWVNFVLVVQSFSREPQLLRAHKYNSYAISRRFYFTALTPGFQHIHLSCLLFSTCLSPCLGSVLIIMSKFYMYSKCCIYCRDVHKLHKTLAGTTICFKTCSFISPQLVLNHN